MNNAHGQEGVLSSDQLDEYARSGFLLARGLLDADVAAALPRWADEALAWEEVRGKYMMYFEETGRGRLLNRMENLAPYHEGFRGLMHDRVRSAAGQLLGEPAVLFKDKINFKLPGGGGFEPHQDVQAGWSEYAKLHLTAMVTIDPAAVSNGCLEIAAGFKGSGLIGREWEPLQPDDLDGLEFVPVETRTGDVVFFDSFVPHRSAPNRSDQPRRVLYCTYNGESEGDSLERYYRDKRAGYPPDIEREEGKSYRYKV